MRRQKNKCEKLLTHLSQMCNASYIILLTGLPVIIAYLLGLSLFLRYFPDEYTYTALILTPSVLEHIFMSLALLVGGALLFDWLFKRDGK